jgi:hypothetical protein
MKELARITRLDVLKLPPGRVTWSVLLVGRNVINNPKALRMDNMKTGDIVYYEKP